MRCDVHIRNNSRNIYISQTELNKNHMGVPDWFIMLNLRLINCHLFKGLVLLPATILSLAGNLQSRTSRFTFIINIKAIVTFVTFKPKVKINDKIILSFCLKYTLKCGYKERWANQICSL